MNTQPFDTSYEKSATRPYLDQIHVLELLADDIVLVQLLLTAYLQASSVEIAALKEAILTEDRRDVVVRAHRLRGSLRYLGTRDLEDMLLEIEAAANQAEPHELLIYYHSFYTAAHSLEQEIRHWQSQLRQTAV
ncbi:Hpt domain-containing protein [Aeromonas veronii]|uniref:Hpt domain-containing protein n=1 Tax=Aeromonas TaxID=642 RepID=UPI0038F516E3